MLAIDLTGQVIDSKYRIDRLIGSGGMGSVFQAYQIELERKVALKILLPAFFVDSESLIRFEREARILAQVKSAHVVEYLGWGFVSDKNPYIAMEYLEGESLGCWLASHQGRLSWRSALEIAAQVCTALSDIHAVGVIHRDLSINNVFVESNTGRIKLIDFGLSRVTGAEVQQNTITQTGALIGSLHYLSPEVCGGNRAVVQSDIYSLGCILYELIAGQKAIDCDNPVGLMFKHANEYPPSLCSVADVSEDVQSIVFKALQKNVSERYQSADEMAKDVKSVLNGTAPNVLGLQWASPVQPARGDKKIALFFIVLVLLLAVASTAAIVLRNRQTRESKTVDLPSTITGKAGGVRSGAAMPADAAHESALRSAIERTATTRGISARRQHVLALVDLADYLMATPRTSEVERLLKQALVAMEGTAGLETTKIRILELLARLSVAKKRYEESEAYATQCLELLRKNTGPSIQRARCLSYLQTVATESGDRKKLLSILRRRIAEERALSLPESALLGAYAQTATLEYHVGNFQEAARLSAAVVKANPKDLDTMANAQETLLVSKLKLHKYSDCVSLAKTLTDSLARRDPGSFMHVNAMINRADVLEHLQKYQEELELYKQLLHALGENKAGDAGKHAYNWLIGRASRARIPGNATSVLRNELCVHLLELARELPNAFDQGRDRELIADILVIDNMSLRKKLIDELLQMTRSPRFDNSRGIMFLALGYDQQVERNFPEAREFHLMAIPLLKKDAELELTNCYLSVARLDLHVGKQIEARKMCDSGRNLLLSMKEPNMARTAEPLMECARIYRSLGDLTASEQILRRASVIVERECGARGLEATRVRAEQACNCLLQKKEREAEQLMKVVDQDLRPFLAGGREKALAARQLFMNMVMQQVDVKLGRETIDDGCLKLCSRALETMLHMPDTREKAIHNRSIAVCYLRSGKYDQAKAMAKNAYDIFYDASIRRPKELMSCLLICAEAAAAQADAAQAKLYIKEIVETGGTALQSKRSPEIARQLQRMADVCRKVGDGAQALQYTTRAKEIWKALQTDVGSK